MKTICIRVIQTILAIAAFALAIYLEDYCFRGSGMFLGMALAVISLIVESISDRTGHFFSAIGCVLYLFFFVAIAMEIHIDETDDGVDIRSPFYTHVLEHGESVEQKKLQSHYTQYYSRINVKSETFYILHCSNGTCSIYNSYAKVISLPDSFIILEHDLGHGNLNYIQVGDGSAYDMRGMEIKDGYRPKIIDITPDYSTSFTN